MTTPAADQPGTGRDERGARERVSTELTDAEREALLEPCRCGHTINDHGSVCWTCADTALDDNEVCRAEFEDLLCERLAGIVDARVAAALAPIEELAAEYEADAARSGIESLAAMHIRVATAAPHPPPRDPAAASGEGA